MTTALKLHREPPEDQAGTDAALSLHKVAKRFGGVVALHEVSFDMAPGELLGLIGPNGAGKSTLLSLISGAQRPSSGTITFKGQRIDRMPPHAVARLGVGRAHQIPRPFRRMTVRENLLVAAHSAEQGLIRRDDHVLGVLELCGLGARAGQLAGTLALLDLKRLEVARALALKPDLLLLDEVAAGLVGPELDEVAGLIEGVHQRGTAILLVEHVQALVRALAERVIVLDWGRKIAEGSSAEIAGDPEVIRVYLGSGEVQRSAAATEGRRGPEAAREDPALLRVEQLDVNYGRLPALRAVDFEAREGEITAVLGANGAGKSSLARAISGLAPVAGGRIWLDGVDVTGRPAHERARRGIALCHEGRRLFADLTVRENLELAAAYASQSRTPLAERLRRLDELFPVLEVRARSRAGELSGGQQQMLAIGRALVTEARVIILDELSLGLAPQAVDAAYEVIPRLREWGIGVILIEQNVYRALAVADRAYVLERGRVSFAGSPAELAGQQALVEAYFGTGQIAPARPSTTAQPGTD